MFQKGVGLEADEECCLVLETEDERIGLYLEAENNMFREQWIDGITRMLQDCGVETEAEDTAAGTWRLFMLLPDVSPAFYF